MEMKPIYEFLIWDNCNNNCKFCFQRENPRLFNKDKRKEILNETLNFIDSDKFEEGSHILVCGGEIFDKPLDFQALDDFFKQIVKRMNEGTIDLLYINTNLIYKDLSGVNNLLKVIQENDLFDRLKFTTSYDLEGRFKNEEDRELMLRNLLWVKQSYNKCQIVSNTILTKPTCKGIIEGTFSIKKFMDKCGCWVNLIPYIVLDHSLTPSRSELFKALQIVGNENQGYLEKYIPNMSIEQKKWLYMYKDNQFQFCSCPMSDCGHSVNFKRYSDKGTCFCCDLKEMFLEHVNE